MPSDQDPLLASILAPLRQGAEEKAAEIREIEADLQAKKNELRTFERVLRAAEATYTAPKKAGPSKAGAAYPVSEDAVGRVLAVLQGNPDLYANGDGFTGTSLHRDEHDALRMSSATVSAALHALRERELIRLVRRGTGGSRVYRLAVTKQ